MVFNKDFKDYILCGFKYRNDQYFDQYSVDLSMIYSEQENAANAILASNDSNANNAY
ncbi:MAG: hypothetical protein HUJ51_01565 [Eggerthellaceae bacterium]|nr:hypothetical protein [Eggerthellaceae bacterium]